MERVTVMSVDEVEHTRSEVQQEDILMAETIASQMPAHAKRGKIKKHIINLY